MRSGGSDREFNAAAGSEYNEGLWAREYAPAREYGATRAQSAAEQNGERKRRRAASARQRALMQATAAVMTAVVVVSAAASNTPRSPDVPVSESETTQGIGTTESDDGNAAAVMEPTAEPIDVFPQPEGFAEEYRAHCDTLLSAFGSGDADAVYRLMYAPVFGDFLMNCYAPYCDALNTGDEYVAAVYNGKEWSDRAELAEPCLWFRDSFQYNEVNYRNESEARYNNMMVYWYPSQDEYGFAEITYNDASVSFHYRFPNGGGGGSFFYSGKSPASLSEFEEITQDR